VTVLTLDLGTSATKAALWDGADLVAITRAEVETTHPAPARAEQDPEAWWGSTVAACHELRAAAPDGWAAVDAVGFSAARETFALFDADLRPLGPGVLWSDARASEEARRLGDPVTLRRATGVAVDGASCAAKVAWVEAHEPDRFAAARWVLAPRDWVVARLTGTVVTDRTLASRTGWYDLDGTCRADGLLAPRLPSVVDSATVVGAARGLGLPARAVVVLGAGDRACEVLGTDATPATPMVSWGTTANVSVPHPGPIEALPGAATVSVGAAGGFLIEVGLSAAGAALDWLARLTGRAPVDLRTAATSVPPGAGGVLALPWLHGARGPWWRPDARASFRGLTGAHGPEHLARAVIEAVALDVARGVDLLAPDAEALTLAGGGAGDPLWRSVLAAVARRPVRRRAIDDAASVGARVLVAGARAEGLAVDALNPVVAVEEPDPALVRAYVDVRGQSDRFARAVMEE
jgi:sugar (pentulose or hexulose) kinase